METAVAKPKRGTGAKDLLRNWLQSWFEACGDFRKWEREELVLRRPSPAVLAEHADMSRTLISTARMLQAIMVGGDRTLREFRSEIEGLLRQLEETSEMIHNPMSDQECDVLLEKYFRDEPGTGSAA